MDKTNFSAFCLVVLVALALATCGVLLINSSSNIAYAMESLGYYDSNYIPNNDCSSWDFNYTINNVSNDNPVVIYDDDVCSFVLYGSGTLINNVLTSSSNSGIVFMIKFKTTLPLTSGSYHNYVFGYSDSFDGYVDLSSAGFNHNANNKYYYLRTQYVASSNDWLRIIPNVNTSVTMRFLCAINTSQFQGYVSKNYSYYGYNQGYTDGVNSASGGTISSDITDLTGMVWVVPDYLTVVPYEHYTYSVSGTVKYTINNREVISDFDSIQLYPISDLSGSSSALCFYQSDDSEFELTARPDFVITFTGGSDITNSDLISWLSSNNQFLTYTQGYQDGYHDGLDIGYDNGYYDGMGSIYTGVLSDYSILSDYSSYGVNNNDLNISSFTMDTNNNYTEFNFNGSTICNNYVRVVGSDDYSGSYTITYTRSGMGTYVGALISSFYIDENSIYKFMFNPEDSFNICIAVFSNDARTSQYLEGYWTYELQTDGYINGVPYMDLTPYIKVWAQYPYCNIYLYNPVVWSGSGEPNSLVLHNRTPIYGLLGNSLIVDNSNGNYNQGFRDGQLQGENIGFTKGWNKANSTGPNSFLGLFSAVIDAPINVISQTLDFDLLGFNLRDFFFSMVSIAVILFILRLIL